DRSMYTAIGRDCGIRIQKIREIILVSFVILSGFVRYPGKPKVEQILILLSTAFGTKNITDKIKKTRVKGGDFSAQRFEKYDMSIVFFKRATRENPRLSEVVEVSFFCFFLLVKKRKVLKVFYILVISMQGFVGRANSLAEHTLYGYKVECVILYMEVIAGKEQKCLTFVPPKKERFTYELCSLQNAKSEISWTKGHAIS